MTHFCDDISVDVRKTIVERLRRWLPPESVAAAKVRTLAGGAINRNYLIDIDEGYVLRLAPPLQSRDEIGIDMANSAVVAKIAGRAGVGPAVVGVDEETGDSLIQFLPGVLNVRSIRDTAVLRRVGSTVRKLHQLPVGNTRRVSVFDELEAWTGNAARRGQLPDNDPEIWKFFEECRTVLENVEGTCLSHRDLNPQNCIQTNGTVKLIDWDFSGVDSPYLDLAMLATYAELDDRHVDVFLRAAIPDFRPEDMSRVQLMRFVHALREWAWCISASDVLADNTHTEVALLPTQASGEGTFYDGYREVNWRFAEHLSNDARWETWLRGAASSLPAPGFR